jgi:hypothetical protein
MEVMTTRIYATHKGERYDLATLPTEHVDFVRQTAKWYRQDAPSLEFTRVVLSTQSPVLKQCGAMLATKTPIYDIATDVQLRLGVKQRAQAKDRGGEVGPKWQAA